MITMMMIKMKIIIKRLVELERRWAYSLRGREKYLKVEPTTFKYSNIQPFEGKLVLSTGLTT